MAAAAAAAEEEEEEEEESVRKNAPTRSKGEHGRWRLWLRRLRLPTPLIIKEKAPADERPNSMSASPNDAHIGSALMAACL